MSATKASTRVGSRKRRPSRSTERGGLQSVPSATPRAELPSRHPPATERGRQSRQRILDAAESIFGREGYFQASIADIVREAGVAQGTFYVYFRSKQHVFVELLHSLAAAVHEAVAAAIANARDRIEEEELGFAAFFSVVNQRPHFYRIIRQAEFVDPVAFRNYYATFVPGYVKRTREAMAKGSVRRMDPETLVYCMMGIADFVGMRWPYWMRKPIPADVFQAMMEFIRFGIDNRTEALEEPRRKRSATGRGRAANAVRVA